MKIPVAAAAQASQALQSVRRLFRPRFLRILGTAVAGVSAFLFMAVAGAPFLASGEGLLRLAMPAFAAMAFALTALRRSAAGRARAVPEIQAVGSAVGRGRPGAN